MSNIQVGKALILKKRKRFFQFLLVPFLLEAFFLCLLILEQFFSVSWMESLPEMLFILSFLYVIASSAIVLSITAKENEAESFTHGAFYRVNITVEEQLELRRKAIASEKGRWEFSMILLAQSLFFLLVNGIILLISWWFAVPALLLSVAAIIFLGHEYVSLRSLLTTGVTGRDGADAKSTPSRSVKELPDQLRIGFSAERFFKLVGSLFSLIYVLIILGSLVDFLEIDKVGIPTIEFSLGNSDFLSSLLVFVIWMLMLLFQLLLLFTPSIIVFVILYEVIMLKIRLPFQKFKYRRDIIIHSVFACVVLVLLSSFIITLIEHSFPVIIDDIKSFVQEVFFFLVFSLAAGVILGMVWWHDVRQEVAVLAVSSHHLSEKKE